MAKHLNRDFELLTEILKEKEPRKFKEGEIVSIIESKPISKKKKWQVIEK